MYSPENMCAVVIFQDKTPQMQYTSELENLIIQAMFDEHTAVMLLIEPLTGQIIDANHAASAFYGYSREKLKSMCIDEISPSFHEEIKRRYLAKLDQENQYFVYPHRLSNGELRMVDVYSSQIHDVDNTYYYLIIFDVTAREKYKQELYNEKELLRLTLESIGDGVVTTDTGGWITFMNRAAQKITGWEEWKSQNIHFNDIFHLLNEETGKPIESPFAKALKSGSVTVMSNTVLLNKQGMTVSLASSAAPIKDERGNIFGTVMVFQDVTHAREQQKQIHYMSYHDELTGLYNRRFAIKEIKRLNRTRQIPLAVIVGDVNGLKITNDALGHAVGDKLLKKVATALKASCREEDIIARWGGDEFIILLPNTSEQTVRTVVKRMKKTFLEVVGD